MRKIKELPEEYLTFSQLAEIDTLQARERRIIGVGLILVILITIYDGLEDFFEGQGVIAIFGDLVYMAVLGGMLIYIWRHVPLTLRKSNLILTREIV
ncbi:MAG: hypothetical protein MJA83_20005, partial [Gammaproteobacteria bacterium]|nr:hypothetical protein [Gammaproteobacteria bacterium]